MCMRHVFYAWIELIEIKFQKKKKTMVIPLRNQMTKEKEIKILLKKFINIL